MTSHRIRVDHMPLGSLVICELRCMCSPHPWGSVAIFESWHQHAYYSAKKHFEPTIYCIYIWISLMYILLSSLRRKYACIPGADFKSNISCDLEFFSHPPCPPAGHIQTSNFSTPLLFQLSGPAQACTSAVVLQRPFAEAVWVQSFAHALHLQGDINIYKHISGSVMFFFEGL